MTLPSRDDIAALHKKHAPSTAAFDSVWGHCQIVQDIALQITKDRNAVNHELISAGALLHDIGVYRLYRDGALDNSKPYITHGLLGYELLKAEGLAEAVCRFALLHTGVGITRADIVTGTLPLPPRDYIAETNEEKIVMYADKFHSKSEPATFNSATWYTQYLATKFGNDKATLFGQLVHTYGEPDLTTLAARYGQPIR